jgi:mono/diheme cytochrome c family protein/glucose/arabinose dehydrogenase
MITPVTSIERSALNAFLLAGVVAVTTYGAQPPPQSRPWPPPVEKIGTEAPVLSPDAALATFSLPPGYRLELVASEPLIQDPIAIEWDTQGRLWAVELPGYMRDLLGSGEYDPTGRIVVLEDTDGDGRMDTRTVFADGLVQPRAIRLLERAVLVAEPPSVWVFEDTTGDTRADRKEQVATGYGRREINVEVNANGLLWALDNRIHTAGTGADLYLRLRHGRFETHRTLSRGQWGISQDDAGRIYRNHNESALHADLVPTPYYARNPNLLRTRGSHEMLIDPAGDVNVVWPIRQTPGTNRAYMHGVLREDGTLAAFTAAGTPTFYRGDRLPEELHGNVFVTEPAANLVSRLVVHDDGTTLRARKAYERGEFVASTDERFRPVNLSSGPDGALYIVDLYRGIIQHRAYITEYLRDQVAARGLEQPIGHGRVWRVVHESTRRDTSTRLTTPAAAELVEMLSHPNGWWRDTAQQWLIERGDTSVAPALVKRAESAPDWRTRLHALWTLDGLDAVEPAQVTRALGDRSREVRASAMRVAERWLGEPDHPVAAAVLSRMDDPDWSVRHQLAASMGALPAGVRESAVATLLERYADSPITLDAALSGVRGGEAAVLERLLDTEAETTQRSAAITMLSAMLVRSGQEAAVQDLFGWAADANRHTWQRAALIRGAEVALLGAAMPGPPPPRRSAPAAAPGAPCPTCPGGRAGPGGAYAFPDAQAATAAAGGGGAGRGAGPVLRLTREPATLSAWAMRKDDLAPRVASVLERIVWPEKPGAAAPAPPLTVAEQERFDAGRAVYQNLCQACHQADGRGQDRLAPTLIGSALALAAAEVPARILLHGKEGPVGLMPPVGSVLTDDQIASVLTYVRREWGQTGTPVDGATIARVRERTAGRTRPWTDQELAVFLTDGLSR